MLKYFRFFQGLRIKSVVVTLAMTAGSIRDVPFKYSFKTKLKKILAKYIKFLKVRLWKWRSQALKHCVSAKKSSRFEQTQGEAATLAWHWPSSVPSFFNEVANKAIISTARNTPTPPAAYQLPRPLLHSLSLISWIGRIPWLRRTASGSRRLSFRCFKVTNSMMSCCSYLHITQVGVDSILTFICVQLL